MKDPRILFSFEMPIIIALLSACNANAVVMKIEVPITASSTPVTITEAATVATPVSSSQPVETTSQPNQTLTSWFDF